MTLLSDTLYPGFYALIRGVGNVEYTANITIFSVSADKDIFLAALFLLIAFHVPRLRPDPFSDPAGVLPLIGAVAGMGLFLFAGSLESLLLIGLSSMAIVAVDSSRSGTRKALKHYALVVLSMTAAVAVLGDLPWVVNGFVVGRPLDGDLWRPAMISLQLLGLLHSILPELVVLFFFSWILRLLPLPRNPNQLGWPADDEAGMSITPSFTGLTSGVLSFVLLIVGIGVAAFVGAYPYLAAVNPTGMVVGVDTNYCYSPWLHNLPGNTICGPLGSVFNNERVGALWALQGLAALMNSPDLAVRSSFALFSILLVISTYVLVVEGTGDRSLAGVAALLTGVSTQVIVGMSAGILANWLAWAFVNFFFAVLLRGMRTQRRTYIIPSFALFAAVLFIHPWTWALVFVILSVYLSLMLLQSGLEHRIEKRLFEVTFLGALVGLGLISDGLKSFLPLGSALVLAVQTIQPYFSLSNIPLMAETIKTTFETWVGGAMGNPLWYILGTIGMLSIPNLRGRFGLLMATWVAAEALGVITIAGATLQSRLITDVPLQVFAAIGVVAILNYVTRPFNEGANSGLLKSKLLVAAMLISVVGLFLGFALEVAGFLYV